MIKLVVFDLDSTLADVNQPIKKGTCDDLFRLEKSGVRVAICTGKPAIYMCGLLRQVGLTDAIIIGENGASIYYGSATPPRKIISMPFDAQFSLIIKDLEQRIRDSFADSIWFQPNTVGLTCFFYDQNTKQRLAQFLESKMAEPGLKEVLKLYRHIDSFDIAPDGIDKGAAITHLAAVEGITQDEIIVVGDGENDYTMFNAVPHSIGVALEDKSMAAHNFDTIESAMKYIFDHLS